MINCVEVLNEGKVIFKDTFQMKYRSNQHLEYQRQYSILLKGCIIEVFKRRRMSYC
jgi:hypothetical protein